MFKTVKNYVKLLRIHVGYGRCSVKKHTLKEAYMLPGEWAGG